MHIAVSRPAGLLRRVARAAGRPSIYSCKVLLAESQDSDTMERVEQELTGGSATGPVAAAAAAAARQVPGSWAMKAEGIAELCKCCYFLDLWAFACSISHVPTRMTSLSRESINLQGTG